MILLTLEGLPRSCVELLKSVQQITKTFIIPSPIAPTATSCHAPADEIVSVLYNILANMRVLQRAQQLADSSIVCGAHWIDTPTTTLDMKARLVLHDVCLELSEELKRAYDLVISKHIIVFLKVPVHDMFNIMLENMEARDVLLDDLIEAQRFLDSLERGVAVPSVFQHVVKTLAYPPCMADNPVDLAITASRVTSALKSLL